MRVQLFAFKKSGQPGFENIGVSRIAAFLQSKGIDVVLTYMSYDKDADTEFAKVDLESDLFGFSSYSSYIEYIFTISKMIKEKKESALVFLGSRFVTDAADLILDEYRHIDFIVLGHGEYPIYDVIKGLENKESIHHIAMNNNYIKTREQREGKESCNIDINLLPWPNRDYLKSSNELSAYISSSHGCVGRCTFCTVTRQNAKWSGRDIDDVITEISDIYKNTGIRSFIFTDGSLEDPGEKGKERIRQFCLQLKKHPVKFAFRCFLRAETFRDNERDREILKLMKEAGFTNIYVGIEAGNEDDLRLFNKKATLEDNNGILNLFSELGIEPLYGYIILNPYSDESRLKMNYDFLVKHKCYDLEHFINAVRVYYNTPMYKKLKKDNLIPESYSYRDFCSYNCINEQTGKILSFLKEYFYMSKVVPYYTNFYSFLHYYKYFQAISVSLDDIQDSLDSLKWELFSQCRDYFEMLYIDNDIEMCIKQYDTFERNIIKLYDKSEVIKGKLLKKYIMQTC